MSSLTRAPDHAHATAAAREQSPLSVFVLPAGPAVMEQLVRWLGDPAIYQDAFWLPARPDPAWVRRSMLVVKNGLGIELQEVRIWSVHHRPRQPVLKDGSEPQPGHGTLMGLAVDYGWDHAGDDVREIDVALPAAGERGPFVGVQTFAVLLHRLFSRHGVTAGVARVRAGSSGAGFPRLFASIGTEAIETVVEEQPLTGRRVTRVLYRCTPQRFYASRLGCRLAPCC